MRVVVGLASGIGNVCFMLPALRALHEAGHHVTAYVAGDYDMIALLRRCEYLNTVVDAKTQPVPESERYLAGHWCPPSLSQQRGLVHARFVNEPYYQCSEWRLPFWGWRQTMALPEPTEPDVADWCVGVRRVVSSRVVGIIPGCKPGDLWARKKYPHMLKVARQLLNDGYDVRWFGEAVDRPADTLPGQDSLGLYSLAELPDELAKCRAIVGTDSGPAHLAASLGVPTVVIYTATSLIKGDPVGRRVRKLSAMAPCSPCQATARWRECTDWKCQGVSVDAVTDAARDVMGG